MNVFDPGYVNDAGKALVPGKFAIDAYDDWGTAPEYKDYHIFEFDGFTAGGVWNGWSCPLFTFEQAMKIVERHKEKYPNLPADYDAATDTFSFETEGTGEADSFTGEDRDGMHVYAIGAYGWTWDERGVHYDAEEEEAKPMDRLKVEFWQSRYASGDIIAVLPESSYTLENGEAVFQILHMENGKIEGDGIEASTLWEEFNEVGMETARKLDPALVDQVVADFAL